MLFISFLHNRYFQLDVESFHRRNISLVLGSNSFFLFYGSTFELNIHLSIQTPDRVESFCFSPSESLVTLIEANLSWGLFGIFLFALIEECFEFSKTSVHLAKPQFEASLNQLRIISLVKMKMCLFKYSS